MKTVLVPIATGFEEMEAVCIIDVLRRAEIKVIVAHVESQKEVTGANGITLVCDRTIDGISSADIDMIVLPGGWGGTDILAGDETVQELLKEMDEKGKHIGAICAAPYALNQAGVLKENFTCYPSVEEKIPHKNYMADTTQVVYDANVMTSRGPGTAICFALQIVKTLVGEEVYSGLKEGVLATYCE
jgi:4-methyl-5(b-hydroxyethyl)-thiazole monophosphate biosynthesis